MTAAELVSLLENVRARGAGKWSARCPAHADKSLSFSVKEGDDGRLLVHCFAGCGVDEIAGALGLRVADLFTGILPTEGTRRTPRATRLDRVALAFRYEMAGLDRRLRAERMLRATRNCDNATLSDDTRERVMGAVASAYQDLERAEVFEHVADTLRRKAFQERTISHAA